MGLIELFRNYALQRGNVVNGRYCLVQHCGSGAFGDVWFAEVLGNQGPFSPGTRVALKFLHEMWNETPVELLAVQEMGPHPNIISVYETGQHSVVLPEETVSFPFLVMEAAQKSLRTIMEEQGGRLRDDQTFAMATQVLAALSAAFGAGIRHRDIKPDNILLGSDGLFKVADFGLAKWTTRPFSRTRDLKGTPWYMPPEAMRHSPMVAQSFDIYGLAVTLYQGLTGELPFDKGLGLTDLLICKEQNDYTPIREYRPDLPQGLWSVLERALHANPQIRFFEPRDFAEALEEVLAEPHRRQVTSFREAVTDLLKQSYVSDAMGLLTKRLAEQPHDHDSALLLGRLYLQGGEQEKAAAVWSRAISQLPEGKHDPHAYHLLFSLAKLWYSKKAFGQAAPLFARAAAIHPQILYPLCLAAACYALDAQFTRAVTHMEKACALAPHLPALRARLGLIYWQLGQHQKAAENWERVLLANSHDHKTRLELARLYKLLDIDRGLRHAVELQRMAPNSQEAREAARLFALDRR